MHKAVFYVHAGLPEISRGEIGTSAKGLQSHQRTQLPGWGCFTLELMLDAQRSLQSLCWGFLLWTPKNQESNKSLAKVILFKTVLCFERKKESLPGWKIKPSATVGAQASSSQKDVPGAGCWLPALLPIISHVYEVLGSVMLACCSALWRVSESPSLACQFFFGFAAVLINGRAWSSQQCENSISRASKIISLKRRRHFLFKLVFPACSKGLWSEDENCHRKEQRAGETQSETGSFQSGGEKDRGW